MPGPVYPKFRRSEAGRLLLTDSEEGRRAAAARPAWSPPLSAEAVEEQARQNVRQRQGDLSDETDVLGEYMLQSGKYRGKSFRWLLENVPGYVGWFVGQIIQDEGKEDPSSINQQRNKNSFKRYVHMFEEGRRLVQIKREEKSGSRFKSLLSGRELPAAVLQHKLKSLAAPATVKPNIPQSQRGLQMPQKPSTCTTAATAAIPQRQKPCSTVLELSRDEDEELAACLEETETSHSVQVTETAEVATDILLYQGWKTTLPPVDRQWVSKIFFRRNPSTQKIEFQTERLTKLWHEPPQPVFSASARNKVDRYFGHRVFLWMPVNMWSVRLICPHSDADVKCGGVLTRAGIHQKTRLVLDVDTYYIIATEYLRCSICGKKVVAWAHNVVNQLSNDRKILFPCILTAKLACDRKVVELMRNRGLGNSSSMLCRQLQEEHGDRYLRGVHHYLSECKRFKAASHSGLVVATHFEEPPEMTAIPQHRWLMKVYQLDVLQRLDYIKASITSLFGEVIKMDSTKKITKKLAGQSAKTAMWATNVGNEHGQVIMTVLTTGEGIGLKDMIDGLTGRYQSANVPPPQILYVDRDCCGSQAVVKYFKEEWPYLNVRLDIWHFMRRISLGCTTDAHQLYGVFMRRLSQCIFSWAEEDVALLKKAKRAEMLMRHIPDPSDGDVVRAITSNELALHCRRFTRGADQTHTLISDLLKSMDGDNGLDILGVPLMDSVRMQEIWTLQSRHIGCIQDPEGVQLYTRVGTLKKGGVALPTYRCARGSTSLESFHLHMNRFIPGTLASDVNFQVYLLDGVYRWNEDRRRDAIKDQGHTGPLCYDGLLQQSVKKLAAEILGKDKLPLFTPPKKYTGELLGLEYLFAQSTHAGINYTQAAEQIEDNASLTEEVEEEQDEGFVESAVEDDLTVPLLEAPTSEIHFQPAAIPTGEEYGEVVPEPVPLDSLTVCRTSTALASTPTASISGLSQQERSETIPLVPLGQTTDDSDVGPDNVPGYLQVLKLAGFLAGLCEQTTPLTTTQAETLIEIWRGLSDYDKQRTRFPQRFATASGSSRFKSPKKQVALGVTSIERAVLGPNPTRANWPDCNRYVEATVQKLMQSYSSDRRSKASGSFTSRWTLVKNAYTCIQALVLGNTRVMGQTDIQLPSLNVKTIQQWYNKQGKERDLKILVQGISLPKPPMSGTGAPSPRPAPSIIVGEGAQFPFVDPPDTAGMAKLKKRRMPTTLPSTGSETVLPLPPMTVLIPIRPAGVPQMSNPPSKRKYVKTATTVMCPKCGEERTAPTHQQYMGHRYCGKTETVPFAEWRATLQSQWVATKGQKKMRA